MFTIICFYERNHIQDVEPSDDDDDERKKKKETEKRERKKEAELNKNWFFAFLDNQMFVS